MTDQMADAIALVKAKRLRRKARRCFRKGQARSAAKWCRSARLILKTVKEPKTGF